MTRLLITATPVVLLAAAPAEAYLDPGSGSMLLYALAGLVAVVAHWATGLYHRLSGSLAARGASSNGRSDRFELVFYSEGGQYWDVFAPVIDALSNKGVACTYFTSDANDPGLSYEAPSLEAEFIGTDARSAAVLNRLRAKLVVMTTPQLDIFRLKRSEHVDHYCFMEHSLGDPLGYRRFAFDHFDSVLCPGPHHLVSIRAIEEARGLRRKRLYETGLTYYDAMLRDLALIGAHGGGGEGGDERDQRTSATVLVAPTWGNNGLLARYGTACFEPLLEAGYRVILRPHPQAWVSEAAELARMQRDLAQYRHLTIDRAPSGLASMEASDILISDMSGINFDYAFLFAKPMLVVDGEFEMGGREAEYVDQPMWDHAAILQLAHLVADAEFADMPALVERSLSEYSKADVEDFRGRSTYNFGHAGRAAADELVGILSA